MVTVDNEVTKQIQERENLVDITNTCLSKTLGPNFKANVSQVGATSRGFTYHLDDKLEYVVKALEPTGGLLNKIVNYVGNLVSSNIDIIQDVVFMGNLR